MLQRAGALIAMVILLFSSCGYLVLFKAAQWKIHAEIREEIKQKLPECRLVLISVTQRDEPALNWEERGEELEYMGTMYDVVRADTSAGIISYYCINDEDETELLADFKEVVNGHQSSAPSTAKGGAKNLKKIFSSFDYFGVKTSPVLTAATYNSAFSGYHLYFHSGFLQPISPPPNPLV